MRVIVASNRGPVAFVRDDRGEVVPKRGAGGLVTALSGALAASGGVWIASADVNNDGHSDVIVGSGNGAGHVKVFSSASLLNGGISNDGTADDSLLESYFAYGASYNKGIFVAASR